MFGSQPVEKWVPILQEVFASMNAIAIGGPLPLSHPIREWNAHRWPEPPPIPANKGLLVLERPSLPVAHSKGLSFKSPAGQGKMCNTGVCCRGSGIHFDLSSPTLREALKIAPTGINPPSLCFATAAKPIDAMHPQDAQSGFPPN